MHNNFIINDDFFMQFAASTINLKEICKIKGISTIAQLSKLSGVHRNTVRAYLNGTGKPFSESFIKIAQALGTPPETLILNPQTSGYETLVRDSIINNLSENLDLAFFIFGSRAKNNSSRKFSDLDIGISGGVNKITTARFLQLKESFENLFEDLPIFIDLVNFDQAPESFLTELEQSPKYLCGSKENYYYIIGYINAKKEQR